MELIDILRFVWIDMGCSVGFRGDGLFEGLWKVGQGLWRCS